MSTQALPRAIARTRRVDLRVVVGLLLFIVGILATSGLVRQAKERTPVLVATRPLEAGETLGPEDLRVAELGLGSGVATVAANELDTVIGRVLTAPLEAGQVLAPGAAASGPSLAAGQVAVSVAVAPAHAAGGSLRAGDRVMLLGTTEPDRPTARTTVLLSEVEVIAVGQEDGPGADPNLTVTLAVSADDASSVVQAANSGVLDLVLLPTGSEQ
ncbi:MAG: Flp pilus assembly protein CpaB [Actinomycetota bacterium]